MTARRISAIGFAARAAVAAAALFASVAIPWAQAGFVEVVERVKPSVVAVGTFQKTRSPPFVFRATGFAVGDGTLIATAAHAIPASLQVEARETMMVLIDVPGTSGPQARDAKTVAVDKAHDVALMRIGGAPLPAVTLGDSVAVRDGQNIAFTGFPIGNALGFYPVTHRGIIASQTPIALPSATAGELGGNIVRSLRSGPFALFQLDATVYPGHSGSPLYDAETGEVIGIVSGGFVKRTKDAAIGYPTGIGFAVPIRYLETMIREMK